MKVIQMLVKWQYFYIGGSMCVFLQVDRIRRHFIERHFEPKSFLTGKVLAHIGGFRLGHAMAAGQPKGCKCV
jgi:hypothetical protein